MEKFSEILLLLIVISSMIILSLIFTFYYFKNNCSLFNIIVYMFFNFVIIIILFFPLVVISDYYIYFQEFLKLSEDAKYAGIKHHIKIFYKVVHYIFYIFSDILIPFGTKFYLSNYHSENILKFKMSLSLFKGLLFSLLFIIGCAIVIIILIIYYPDQEINEIENNYEGWDGFMFNLRNAYSLFELEYYIILFFHFIYFKGIYCNFYCVAYLPCCKDSEISEARKNIFAFWTLGLLTKENEKQNDPDSNNKLNEIESALKEMKEERKGDLIKKTKDDLTDKPNPCIPKVVKDILFGVSSIIIAIIIFEFEIHNSFNGLYIVNYQTLKSDWDKNEEEHEKIENGIFSDLILYFFYSYLYIFILIYMIFQKKFINEYLPYIGGNHNGFGLIILLKLILEKVISINYLIFFPIIKNDHKAIIHSYFNLISFSLGAFWVILIKCILFAIPFFFLLRNCFHDDLFDLIKKREKDVNVQNGVKYFNSDSNLDNNDIYDPLALSNDNNPDEINDIEKNE